MIVMIMKKISIFLVTGLFGVLCVGCNVLEDLGGNPYAENYFPLICAGPQSELAPEPEVQQTLMRRHVERVDFHTKGGWEILGESEFNTSNSVSHRHLLKHARSVGAELVVHSSQFDRSEQEWSTHHEYEPGERITVNGTTIERPGKWVDRHQPVTRRYHDYRATFLRPRRE